MFWLIIYAGRKREIFRIYWGINKKEFIETVAYVGYERINALKK